MADPAIRGAVDKALLTDLGMLRAELFAVVCDRTGPSHIDAIESASGISWVPVEHGAALRDAAVEALGREDYVRLIHSLTMRSLDVPAFRTLGAGLMRMFEASPAGLARAWGRAWSTFTRNAGTFVVSSKGPQCVVASYIELPQAVRASPGLLATHEGSYRAALDLAGAAGRVEREDHEGRVDYRVSW